MELLVKRYCKQVDTKEDTPKSMIQNIYQSLPKKAKI